MAFAGRHADEVASGEWEPIFGARRDRRPHKAGCRVEVAVIILGAILLIIGLVASIQILVWIGIVLLIVGLVLNLIPIGGTRRRYY